MDDKNDIYDSYDSYYGKRLEYFFNQLDSDVNEVFINAYAAFCGITLVDVDGMQIPISAFIGVSFSYLGKYIFDIYNMVDAYQKWRDGTPPTKPLRLRKIIDIK